MQDRDVEIQAIQTRLQELSRLRRSIHRRVTAAATPATDTYDEDSPLTYENIIKQTQSIAQQIMHDFSGEGKNPPILISLMDGAMPFASKLQEYLVDNDFEFEYTTMLTGSYKLDRTGELEIFFKDKVTLGGANIIIVDDVFDTGGTFKGVQDYLLSQGAASVFLAVLVNKEQERTVNPDWSYIGFNLGKDDFIIGFGLDYDGGCRNLRDIKIVDRSSLQTTAEQAQLAEVNGLQIRLRQLIAERKEEQARLKETEEKSADSTSALVANSLLKSGALQGIQSVFSEEPFSKLSNNA